MNMTNAPYLILLYILLPGLTLSIISVDYQGCEPLISSLYCADDPNHNFWAFSQYIQMPNMLGDETQRESAESTDFMAQVMVDMGLSTPYDLNYRRFSCAIFLPSCLRDGSTPPPCRELCQLAKEAAQPLKKLGHPDWWPEEYKCSNFPSMTKEQTTCVPPYNEAPGDQNEESNNPIEEASMPPGGGGDAQGKLTIGPGQGGGDEHETTIQPGQGGSEEGGTAPVHQDPRCLDITQAFSMNKCTCTCQP